MKENLLVKVIFNCGGRTKPVLAGYRPHFVLPGSGHLMGIEFVDIMDEFAFNFSLNVKVRLMYDGVDYSSLSIGTNFNICEGSHIVGNGTVIGV